MLMRSGYLAIGWTCVGLGTVGAFLPLLPTTVFLIAAAWAFARADPKYHRWLLEHRRFGPVLRSWERHRALPRRAKVIAYAALALSYGLTAWVFGPTAWPAVIAAICILAVALYLARLPALTPEQEAALK